MNPSCVLMSLHRVLIHCHKHLPLKIDQTGLSNRGQVTYEFDLRDCNRVRGSGAGTGLLVCSGIWNAMRACLSPGLASPHSRRIFDSPATLRLWHGRIEGGTYVASEASP